MIASLRDWAVILLSIQALLILLLPLALFGGTAYGVIWLRRKLPPLFSKVRHLLARIQWLAERASSAVAAPLIAAYALAARLAGYWRALSALVAEED